MDRFLREPEVQNITGLSRTTRWRLAREGKFPKPYSIGSNAVAWRESDIQNWMDQIVSETGDSALQQPEPAAA